MIRLSVTLDFQKFGLACRGGLLESMAPGSVILLSSTCTPDHVKMLAVICVD